MIFWTRNTNIIIQLCFWGKGRLCFSATFKAVQGPLSPNFVAIKL
jgi:hypothetical protein